MAVLTSPTSISIDAPRYQSLSVPALQATIEHQHVHPASRSRHAKEADTSKVPTTSHKAKNSNFDNVEKSKAKFSKPNPKQAMAITTTTESQSALNNPVPKSLASIPNKHRSTMPSDLPQMAGVKRNFDSSNHIAISQPSPKRARLELNGTDKQQPAGAAESRTTSRSPVNLAERIEVPGMLGHPCQASPDLTQSLPEWVQSDEARRQAMSLMHESLAQKKIDMRSKDVVNFGPMKARRSATTLPVHTRNHSSEKGRSSGLQRTTFAQPTDQEKGAVIASVRQGDQDEDTLDEHRNAAQADPSACETIDSLVLNLIADGENSKAPDLDKQDMRRQKQLRGKDQSIDQGPGLSKQHDANQSIDDVQPIPSHTGNDTTGDLQDSISQRHQSSNSDLVVTSLELDDQSAYDQVRTALQECIEECNRETEYWNRICLSRARQSHTTSQDSVDFKDVPVSFASIHPIDLSEHDSLESDDCAKLKIDSHVNSKIIKSARLIPFTKLDTTGFSREVPSWLHYVSIKDSFVSTNKTTIQTLPYFGDDFDGNHELNSNLGALFNLDFDGREHKLKRLMQAERLEEFVDDALAAVNCDWEAVIQVTLDTNADVGLNLEARSAIARKDQWYHEAQLKGEERVSTVLSLLPPSDQARNAKAAIFCDLFMNMAQFSLWHIARRHPLGKTTPKKLDKNMEDRLCCVCYKELCTQHGEMLEYDEEASDRDYGSEEEHALSTDIVHPLRVNFRTRCKFPPETQSGVSTVRDVDALAQSNPRKDPRKIEYWMDPTKYQRVVECLKPFYPCYHPDQTCDEAQCSCVKQRFTCNKSCGCASSCPRKFRGCSCKSNAGQSVCFKDDRCVCWQLNRECDPALCGSCGVYDILNPRNRDREDLLTGRCANAELQRRQPKHTMLGESAVHGFGLYACEDVKPNEFIGEYVGEIITKQEAERRAAFENFRKMSYLFTLNAVQEVDSTYFGNKTRFINHLQPSKCNVKPRISVVNSVNRIGLYACKRIRAGDELFFDYGPEFPSEQFIEKKPTKSIRRARKSEDLASFYDAEVEVNEEGNRRVRKTTRGDGSARYKGVKTKEGPGRGKSKATLGRRAADRPSAKAKATGRKSRKAKVGGATYVNDAYASSEDTHTPNAIDDSPGHKTSRNGISRHQNHADDDFDPGLTNNQPTSSSDDDDDEDDIDMDSEPQSRVPQRKAARKTTRPATTN